MTASGNWLERARGAVARWLQPRPTPLERWNAAIEQLQPSAADRAILTRVRGTTMTGPVRLQAMLDATSHVVARNIPGALVECGVWRGGSVLAMLLKLIDLGHTDRDVWLYDTFEGMTEPTAADTSKFEQPAPATWAAAHDAGQVPWHALFNKELFNETDVRRLILDSGYPPERLHFIKGPVEQTLPAQIPDWVALLRLDTDWYESTRHELQHLYPRLAPGGVLIVDDYGHWDGCRKAVDEYFAAPGVTPILLQRIDYTGRIAVRP